MPRTHLSTIALALTIVAVLILLVAACGAAPTPTPVPTPTPLPTPTPAPPTPTLTLAEKMANASFSKDVLPVLQKNCTRCHSGANPPTGLDLTSYAGVMKGNQVGAVVQPDTSYGSALYQVLPRGTMPQGADKLSDDDMQKIAAWIAGGAKDN
jgi:uncharacterized membrane protein